MSVLAGVLDRPAGRRELDESAERPACRDLDQDVFEIAPRIETEQQAVVDERVRDSETFTSTRRAREQKVAATYSSSQLILPMSHFKRRCSTRGTPPMAIRL
jgi:hypothetical protein